MGYDIDTILRMTDEDNLQKSSEESVTDERIVQLPPRLLQDFPASQHKFKPAAAPRMEELKKSIQQNGIINALIVRQLPSGDYQILTGHNRRQAAIQLGLSTVPCLVKNVPNDDDAISIMIADNLDNRQLCPTEKGWAYRQLREILHRQGTRCGHGDHRIRNLLDEDKSGRQVQRYIRLTYLIVPLADLVDKEKIGLRVGEQLSYLSEEAQETVYLYCYAYDPMHPLKEGQVKALREVDEDPDGVIDDDLLEELTAKPVSTRLRMLKIEMSSLRDYFPRGTSEEVVLQTIQTALAQYFEKSDSSPQNNT